MATACPGRSWPALGWGAWRGDAGAAVALVREAFAELGVVERVVGEVDGAHPAELLLGDEPVEVELERSAERAVEIVVGRVAFEPHGDVGERLALALEGG